MILYPLFAQVFLTFAIMTLMAIKRVGAAKARRYKLRDIAVNSANYPEDIKKYGNSYKSQFEQPVLFYVLCVLLILNDQHDKGIYYGLAGLYVVLRYLHAFIHVTSNHVPRRFYAFLAGSLVLVVLWGLFAAQIIFDTF